MSARKKSVAYRLLKWKRVLVTGRERTVTNDGSVRDKRVAVGIFHARFLKQITGY